VHKKEIIAIEEEVIEKLKTVLRFSHKSINISSEKDCDVDDVNNFLDDKSNSLAIDGNNENSLLSPDVNNLFESNEVIDKTRNKRSHALDDSIDIIFRKKQNSLEYLEEVIFSMLLLLSYSHYYCNN
jgi:hypothetical protein